MLVELKQGLLTWRSCGYTPSLPLPTSLRLSSLKISATVESVNESIESHGGHLTAKERRQLRNGRRESKAGTNNWREEVEERLIKKPKKRYTSWTEQLNLDNLALLGPQWWVVRVSRVAGHEIAERLARLLARNFPSMEFKVYIPSVQIKKKLKNGTISVKPKPLFPGCVFLRCVLNKEVHDFIRECDGIGGFVGTKVGNTKRQINKPKPVDAEDMEAMFKRAKLEQDEADQAFLEENQGQRPLDFQKLYSELHSSSLVDVESNASGRAPGRRRKAVKPAVGVQSGGESDANLLLPGSTIQVVTGSFAGFSGILKKFDSSTGLVTVSLTLFGKETLADLDVNDFVAGTK